MGQLDAGQDPARPALDAGYLNRSVGAPWQIRVVAETASTNTDLLAAAAQGAAEGTVLVAEFQRTGRGRLDRTWSSPPRAGLTVSLLLRPHVAPARWGWLPLLTGVAVADAVGLVPGVGPVLLKWPNDLLLGPEQGKAAGILVQAGPGVAVVGIGLNVDTDSAELAVPTATSLRIAGATELDRSTILLALLDAFWSRYEDWQRSGGDPAQTTLPSDYRALSTTIGTRVSVELGIQTLTGIAVDLDADGRLVLEQDGIRTSVAAGDITHLRRA